MSLSSQDDAEYLRRRAKDASGLHRREEDRVHDLDEPTLLISEDDLEDDLEPFVEEVPDELVDFGQIASAVTLVPTTAEAEPQTIPKLSLAPYPTLDTLAPASPRERRWPRILALLVAGALVAAGAFHAGRSLGGPSPRTERSIAAPAPIASIPTPSAPAARPATADSFAMLDPEMGIDSAPTVVDAPAAIVTAATQETVTTPVAPTPDQETAVSAPEPASVAPARPPELAQPRAATPPAATATRASAHAPRPAAAPESRASALSTPRSSEARAVQSSVQSNVEAALAALRTTPTAEAASRPEAPAQTSSSPQVPPRAEILRAMESVRGAVRACATHRGGLANVRVTVSSVGHVTTAVVGGEYEGTSVGSCIARAVRAARFAEFQQSRFVFDYPFQL